jgi:hypothetical protein
MRREGAQGLGPEQCRVWTATALFATTAPALAPRGGDLLKEDNDGAWPVDACAAAARRTFHKVYIGAIGDTTASVMDSSLRSPTSEMMEDTRQVNRLAVIRS